MKTLKNITEDTFNQFVTSLEYAETYDGEHPNHVCFVKNIQCEIRRGNMAVGFRATQTVYEQLLLLFKENSIELTDKQPNAYIVLKYHSNDPNEILEHFGKILTLINNADINFARASQKRYSGINREGLFANIATVIKAASDTQMYDMIDRKVFDSVDDIIRLNEPLSEDSYREHIVPCTMIIEEAFRMYDEDFASVVDVAIMIQQNLFIYHITKDQAHHLDYVLGLKTCMPNGWQFGDCPKARLAEIGITD